jgi:hypothetical protein
MNNNVTGGNISILDMFPSIWSNVLNDVAAAHDDATVVSDDAAAVMTEAKSPERVCVESYHDPEKTCCICCTDHPIIRIVGSSEDATLEDISPEDFSEGFIPDDLLFMSVCRKHYLCTTCIRKIIHQYDSHPINENNSLFSCPYPFEKCQNDMGFSYTYGHHLIKKICRTEREWNDYVRYTEQYAFPGFTMVKCPFPVYLDGICNSIILVENTTLREAEIGHLIISCDQNPRCLKRFCYHCKTTISYSQSTCPECRLRYENEHPDVFNYYFTKDTTTPITEEILDRYNPDNPHQHEDDSGYHQLLFDEKDYLYLNKEITHDIAVKTIMTAIRDVHDYMRCAICDVSLYKTEKCNGLSHHGIERCYVCGRIGEKLRGLTNHWSASGIEGCFRFDNDNYVETYLPFYKCREIMCFNHEMGDCEIPEHQVGILSLVNARKCGYVYHMLKSLMPSIRYQVYDTLYDYYNTDEHKEDLYYLPYKQTLLMIEHAKARTRDYSEAVVYYKLGCRAPCDIPEFVTCGKGLTLAPEEYITKYGYTQVTRSFLNDIVSPTPSFRPPTPPPRPPVRTYRLLRDADTDAELGELSETEGLGELQDVDLSDLPYDADTEPLLVDRLFNSQYVQQQLRERLLDRPGRGEVIGLHTSITRLTLTDTATTTSPATSPATSFVTPETQDEEVDIVQHYSDRRLYNRRPALTPNDVVADDHLDQIVEELLRSIQQQLRDLDFE